MYAERDPWERADVDARYRVRVRAGVLTATAAAVISHSSSAALLGLPIRPRWRELVHLTRPGVTGGRTEGGVKHHLAGYDSTDVVTVDGLHLMHPARTAVDIGREFGFEDGVVAADAALRLGATAVQLESALERMRNWPGVTSARSAVQVADGGAASIGESLLRLFVRELGVGVPETQFEVRDHGRTAAVDLRLRRHLFEFDGKIKYVGRDRGGVADKSPEEIVWEEKRREDWLRNHDGGYGMSRVVWSELFGRARDETKRRLAREYAESQRRYGHLD